MRKSICKALMPIICIFVLFTACSTASWPNEAEPVPGIFSESDEEREAPRFDLDKGQIPGYTVNDIGVMPLENGLYSGNIICNRKQCKVIV